MKIWIIAALSLMILPVYAQQSRKVYFNNTDTIRFGATYTIPAGKLSYPAIILVSGTGKQDRDGTMAGHKMFKYLADSLSAAGFAVLRMDDRGVGETNGIYELATTEDFANDALAALGYLQRQPGVSKVGLLGHSEGGAAVMIAAAKDDKVAFVITLAGLATPGLEALRLQNKAIIDAAPISDYDKNRHWTINSMMFDTVYHYAGKPGLEQKLRDTYAQWKHKDDSAFAKDRPGEHDHMRFFIESYARQATGAWYQFHIKFDPARYLHEIKVPFFAMNGDKDIMVPAHPNLDNIREMLNEGGNYQVKTVLVPGMNHLMLHCDTCTNAELTKLHGDFDLAAWRSLKEWLVTHIL